MKLVGYKRVLFFLTILMVCVSGAHGETIFETFDTDPVFGNWTSSTPGDSTFTYSAMYLEVDYVRDPVKVDRYTTTLSTTNDRTQEYWWEVDIQMDSSSYFGVKMGSTGLFNSANDNGHNVMRGEYGYGSTKRIDWQVLKSDGSYRYKAGPGTADDAILRLKCHYWVDGSNMGRVRMDVYDIPTDTLVGTTGDQSVVTATESVFYNLFGLANIYGSYQGASRSLTAKIDNLYFSTDGANASPVLPSFYSVEIDDVTAVTTLNSLDIDTTLYNPCGSSENAYIRHHVYEDEDTGSVPYIEVTSPLLSVPAGNTVLWQSLHSSLSPNIWSLNSPNTYLLRTDVLSASMELLNRKDNIIGFRTFEIDGNNMELNGKQIYMTGLAQMPPGRIPSNMYMDSDFIDQHITRLKQANINFVRLTGAPDVWFEACDRAGIMVIDGCYSGSGSTDPNQRYYNLEVLEEVIPRVKNHPSVVIVRSRPSTPLQKNFSC